MSRKVNFVWVKDSWKWEATRYEGNGIFYGKVSSPYVPSGEWGTWYLWEILDVGAKLIAGDKAAIELIKKKTAKTAKIQKMIM